ncbi:hypothetical protein Tco_0587576 [Tanacetum coccineum]|uniref:J domain-containing protein n=1 Tax=Tanacetum coccineum TaxID=301880 RepID=A0ABQ5DM37_9ASTR
MKHVGGKKHSDLKTKTFKEIQVLYERLKRQDQNFVAIGSAKDERQIKELNKDPKKKRVIKETPREEDTTKVPAEQEVTEQEWEIVRWRLYEACGVCILELKDGTIIYMLVERRLSMHHVMTMKHWLVQKQTTFGKYKSNPLIGGSLLKTIRLLIHLVVYNEELAIPEQTTTGKGIPNPLMAGSLPKTTKPT